MATIPGCVVTPAPWRGSIVGAVARRGGGLASSAPPRSEPLRLARDAVLLTAGAAAALATTRPLACRRAGRTGRGRRASRTRRRLFGGISLGPLFEDPAEQTRRRYQQQVEEINSLEPSLKSKSDSELRAVAAELRSRARAGGEELSALLPEAFALVREASRRVLGLRHFDVQLMGGMVLHEGGIAEMATGEGKTLVAILPAFLNSLGGSGVHVVTTNDYLARRDAEWVGQPLRFLGAAVGVVQSDMAGALRKRAYACDVTYVTNNELGFDYLRDQLAASPGDLVLRAEDPFHFAIVDEVDSVLIDEARTPLVISQPAEKPSEKYARAQELAGVLNGPLHYTLEEKERRVALTAEGVEEAERLLGKGDLFDPEDPWAPFVVNALNAKEFFQRDKQYIVRDGKVVIVDEFTGRPMAGRRWSAGLHQAVEAKEGVEIEAEAVTLASISYQSLFRLFGRLSGMTGTAETEAEEFEKIYDLQVSVVPTNRACQREDDEDQVYVNDASKWNAVAREIAATHRAGRPVLVGTTSVENSELVAARLAELQVPCRLLNAKPENAAREAEIIAGSGRKGAVTIATNMAGRGTDILLGGSSAVMARLKLREELYPQLFPQSGEGWSLPEDFYPAEVSVSTMEPVRAVVGEAMEALRGSELTELEAGELLSRACEALEDSSGDEASPAEIALRRAYRLLEGEYRAMTEAERKEVLQLGGLYVIGTERHESRRIDNQLRGRAGRQGDPGMSRFYLSLTDNVFRVFGGEAIAALGDMSGPEDVDVPLGSPFLTGALDEAQKQVESFFYGIRKDVFKFDSVMDKQRRVLYRLRRRALLDTDDNLAASMCDFNADNMEEYVQQQVNVEEPVEKWPFQEMARKLSAWFMDCLCVQPEQLREVAEAGGGGEAGAAALREWMTKEGQEAIARKEELIEKHGPGLKDAARRQVMLMQVDTFWQRHLRNMEFLRNSAKLRAYGNQDPLVEYKRDGYSAFLGMMGRIRRNSVFYLFNFKPRPLTAVAPDRLEQLVGQAPSSTHGDAETLKHILGEVRQRLSSSSEKAYDGKVLVPLGELSGQLAEAGAETSAEQLRCVAAGDGLELLEDNFAKAYYVALKDTP